MKSKCYVAMITPFTEANAIDYESAERIIEKLISEGVSGLMVCGTTGESPTLSENEKLDFLEFVINQVNKRCEVWFGAGSNATCDSVRLIKLSEQLDFDGYLIVVPYYNKPSQYGLYEHFAVLAENARKNIMLYNVPGRCGVARESATVIRLAKDFKNIVALKQADHNLQMVSEILAELDDFNVYSGEDGYLLEGMIAGMSGVVSVIGHLYTPELIAFFEAYEQGEDCTGKDIFFKLIARLFFLESNPSCVKYLYSKMGLCKNILRLPMSTISEKTCAQLDTYFK